MLLGIINCSIIQKAKITCKLLRYPPFHSSTSSSFSSSSTSSSSFSSTAPISALTRAAWTRTRRANSRLRPCGPRERKNWRHCANSVLSLGGGARTEPVVMVGLARGRPGKAERTEAKLAARRGSLEAVEGVAALRNKIRLVTVCKLM